MFSNSSRYLKVPQITTQTETGQSVRAIRLRRLPAVQGAPYTVQQQDRLDILAHRQYNDSAGFWRIADANTALEARQLTEIPLRTILI